MKELMAVILVLGCCAAPCLADSSLTLYKGWNFVSVPVLNPVYQSPGYQFYSLFSGVDTAGHSSWRYNAGTGTWEKMFPDSAISPLDGIWIYSNGSMTIPVTGDNTVAPAPKPIYPGWNAVGFAGLETPAGVAFSSLSGTWQILMAYSGQFQQYGRTIFDSEPTLEIPAEPGQGYWLYAGGPGQYSLSPVTGTPVPTLVPTTSVVTTTTTSPTTSPTTLPVTTTTTTSPVPTTTTITPVVTPVTNTNLRTIPSGGDVFIGEQGLILPVPAGTVLSWYTGSQTVGSSTPSATITVTDPNNFYVVPQTFVGHGGNWYIGNTNTVAIVANDPAQFVNAWDQQSGKIVTGQSIPAGDFVNFRIETNLNTIPGQREANVAPSSHVGYINIKVKAPDGTIYTALQQAASTSISLTGQSVNAMPYFWVANTAGPYGWATGIVDAQGHRVYKAGAYTFWTECNLNGMKDNYKDPSGNDYVGKTVSSMGMVTVFDTVTQTPTQTQTPVTTLPTTQPTTVAPSPTPTGIQPGTQVSSRTVFGTRFGWYQYQIVVHANGTTTQADLKTEISDDQFQGTPAVHYKNTMVLTGQAITIITDIFYSTSFDAILGGTVTTIMNGQTITTPIPANQLQTYAGNANFQKESILVYQGTETITVPAGTFVTKRYTASIENGTATYWVADGVPVPVKYYILSNDGSDVTAELEGWG